MNPDPYQNNDGNQHPLRNLLTPKRSDEDSWLISYSDLMTLLLTFFVLLLSISSIDMNKFERVANSLSRAIGEKEEKIDLEEVYQEIKQMIEDDNLGGEVEARKTPLGVAMSIQGAFLFESGSAELSPKALPLVRKIGEMIKSVPYQIAIEGHTDDVPIYNPRFPSNWELSAARASGIVRYLVQLGVEKERLRAIGYGDTRPVLPNRDPDTGIPIPENRAKNRRIVVQFLAF